MSSSKQFLELIFSYIYFFFYLNFSQNLISFFQIKIVLESIENDQEIEEYFE